MDSERIKQIEAMLDGCFDYATLRNVVRELLAALSETDKLVRVPAPPAVPETTEKEGM